MFDNRRGHAEYIRLLESGAPDEARTHLCRNGNHRDGVRIRIRNCRNHVGGTRSGGGHADADLARDSAVPLSGKGAPLLMAGENRTNGRLVAQRLVNRHAGSAGVGEHDIHTL